MTFVTNPTNCLYSSLADDPDLSELVEMFVEEMPERVEALRGALDAGNLASLAQLSHQLKGAAGSYGFDQLTPLATAVENAASANQPAEQIQFVLQELVSACHRITAELPC